ncbi:MAG: type II toxin-antitoxin system VapC family toxin [Verrucomicrobiota bacterium]|jgi:predicted nucleic acid-binding protein
MIADTTFLVDFHNELCGAKTGPASRFLHGHRSHQLITTVISAGEFAAGFDDMRHARIFLCRWRILNLQPEIAYVAAQVDRELMDTGGRLGENDTWIAGFARFFNQPLISNDKAFDRVCALRRLNY